MHTEHLQTTPNTPQDKQNIPSKNSMGHCPWRVSTSYILHKSCGLQLGEFHALWKLFTE